jgi:hypothetical protein
VDGLSARNNTNERQHIYAEKGFPITVAGCRTDGFPGTICYYYEVKSQSYSKWCVILPIIGLFGHLREKNYILGYKKSKVGRFTRCGVIGLLYNRMNFGVLLPKSANTYAIATILKDSSGVYVFTEGPVETRPESPNVQGNVYGCGLLIDPDNELTIFFTLNGILLGELFLNVSRKFRLE